METRRRTVGRHLASDSECGVEDLPTHVKVSSEIGREQTRVAFLRCCSTCHCGVQACVSDSKSFINVFHGVYQVCILCTKCLMVVRDVFSSSDGRIGPTFCMMLLLSWISPL